MNMSVSTIDPTNNASDCAVLPVPTDAAASMGKTQGRHAIYNVK